MVDQICSEARGGHRTRADQYFLMGTLAHGQGPCLEQGKSVRGKGQEGGTAVCCSWPPSCPAQTWGQSSWGEGVTLSLGEPGGKVLFECSSLLLAT